MTQRFCPLGSEVNRPVHKKTYTCRSTHGSPKLEIIQISLRRRRINGIIFHTMERLIHAICGSISKNIKLAKQVSKTGETQNGTCCMGCYSDEAQAQAKLQLQ